MALFAMNPNEPISQRVQPHSSTHPLRAACAVSLLLSGYSQTHADIPSAASSTNSPTSLPEVVVRESQEPTFKVDSLSSPKFTQPLLDTPQTVVAVPKEVFTQQGAMTLSDVLRNTPGITFAAGEGGNVASGDSFFMRGFDASNNLFVDGVRSPGAISRDVFNIEQVEIAKGPAGADTGRGGSSGYVNLATKAPRLTPAYIGTFSYGSADVKRVTADLNHPTPLGEKGDWLQGTALRLNSLWQDGGVPGRDHVQNSSWAMAPSLALGLGTPTRVVFRGSFTEQENLPDSGLPIVALPGALPTTPPISPVNQSNYYGIANQDFERVSSASINAAIEHDLSERVTLRNQTVFTTTSRDALLTYFQNSTATMVDPATGTVSPRRIHNETHNEIFSNQLNATLNLETGPVEHDLSGGIETSSESQFVPTWTATPGPSTSLYSPDVERPVTAAQIPSLANNLPYTDGRINTAAVYLFDTVKLNQYFQLNGSVRWESYQVDYTSLAASTNATDRAATRLENSGDLLSWKGGIVFKPLPHGSIYAAIANSLQPPGTTFTLSGATNSLNNANSLFDPVENRNYEVGTKWEFFQGKLSTSFALYRSDNLNNLVQDTTTLEFVQAQENRVQGVEYGISGRITDSWFVFGGMGFADSEFIAPSGTSGAANNGAPLRFTPRWSGNLWTSYKLPFGLIIGGGVQYTDSVLRSTSGTPPTPTTTTLPLVQDFWVFNAMLGYDVSKNLNLRLNVNNVFDEDYYRLNNNGGRYYPGVPRSFLLTASLSF
jgi:catecholate siderophore receptor